MSKYLHPIPQIDPSLAALAQEKHNRLTKPQGSLGLLESLGIKLAGIQNRLDPECRRTAIVVAAASHGIAQEQVSAYPAEVTEQMLTNFLKGGAAINALAQANDIDVFVVDAGVDQSSTSTIQPLIRARTKGGSNNFLHEEALPQNEVVELINAGVTQAQHLASSGISLIALGDMGIGNTTTSAAVTSVILNYSPEEVCGYGTGIDESQKRHKSNVIRLALERHQPSAYDAIDILSKIGGCEIAYLCGVCIGAAQSRVAVVLDGFPTSCAALLASLIHPAINSFYFGSHLSQEPGHQLILNHLKLQTLFDFKMRLGEGTGAALAIPIIRGAASTLSSMACFEEAGVTSIQP